MTKIYFVRHCEAEGNIMRIFQGTTDLDITELGAKQLKFIKKRFENVNLDKIYTSPLIRAKKTALAVKGNKQIEVTVLDSLCELYGGVVEGKKFVDAFDSIEGLADIWKNHPQDFAPQDGESMLHAYDRIFEALNFIIKNNQGKTVACASHGGVIRCLLCRLLYNDITKLKEVPWSENTAVTLIESDDDNTIRVKFFNDFSHLPKELISNVANQLSNFGKEKDE
ncbi:MAG: histidine phosphatase family protein [Acutalibacteraceae bacterium]|nr:histidine phosphatase family protein [Acutalibacteraceae bacterium]